MCMAARQLDEEASTSTSMGMGLRRLAATLGGLLMAATVTLQVKGVQATHLIRISTPKVTPEVTLREIVHGRPTGPEWSYHRRRPSSPSGNLQVVATHIRTST